MSVKAETALFAKPKDQKRRRKAKNHSIRNKRRTKRGIVIDLDKKVRAEVFERDNHTCVRCGKTKALAPSHVYPKGRYPRLRFMEINILTMCYGCHIHWWHKHPIEAADWFLKNFPDRAKQLSFLKDTAPKVEFE